MTELLVYEEVPERTRMFIFRNPTDRQRAILVAANGTIINDSGMSDEQEDAAHLLSELLFDNGLPDNCSEVVPSAKPTVGPFDTVYFAGFIL
jgi:hypothetical protein